MCNKGFQCLNECESEIDHRQKFSIMDSPIRSLAVGLGSDNDNRRVKVLCSFLESIIPREEQSFIQRGSGLDVPK